MTAKELIEQLNITDELVGIEAKGFSDNSRSVMETVCSFSNEPGLGGGYILYGAVRDNSKLPYQYYVEEISDPDKVQTNIATQCAGMFNIPIRPEISVDQINGKNVVVIRIQELSGSQKPLYFNTDGLPHGAYRRIGPTDHRCTEDDMRLFYSDQQPYDQSTLALTNMNDVDNLAIKRYRNLREKINATAEELTFGDVELLQSLGCIAADESEYLTIAGLILFGKSSSLRRVFPMMRVDYIRVPGNEWVPDPDDRFTAIDMRGPLLTLVYRAVDAIYSDLPKTFRLGSEDIQAGAVGMPVQVIREAVTNALMHRSYRVNASVQIIRYDNRIEIINAGYSLKSEDHLGSPGSEARNPFIAAVFHETNLAETKGTGIRAMRKLLKKAHLAAPTFESDRELNRFTVRLLLHHFLSNKDLVWLASFQNQKLSDAQKQALIFVREVGAINNRTYRQFADVDALQASVDLRNLRDLGFLVQKGKTKGSYYVAGSELTMDRPPLNTDGRALNTDGRALNTDGRALNTDGKALNTDGKALNTDGKALNTEPQAVNTEPQAANTEPQAVNTEGDLLSYPWPQEINERIKALKRRERDVEKVKNLIEDICGLKNCTLSELGTLFQRDENWISRKYLKPLINEGRLSYTIPEMIRHPDQAYRATSHHD